MTDVFKISLTYVHIIMLCRLHVKNINANDTEFPRTVTLDPNFITRIKFQN
jgi:hypothetical protein